MFRGTLENLKQTLTDQNYFLRYVDCVLLCGNGCISKSEAKCLINSHRYLIVMKFDDIVGKKMQCSLQGLPSLRWCNRLIQIFIALQYESQLELGNNRHSLDLDRKDTMHDHYKCSLLINIYCVYLLTIKNLYCLTRM